MEIEVYLCACKTGQDCDLRVTEFEPSSLHAGREAAVGKRRPPGTWPNLDVLGLAEGRAW